MPDDSKARMEAFRRLTSHRAIRRIWEQELWRAFGDKNLRRQFERETGIKPTTVIDVTLEEPTRDPKVQLGHDFIAFGGWFGKRCWPKTVA